MTIHRLPFIFVAASLAFMAACGSSGGSSALSDAEFCREIERLEETEPTNDIRGAAIILADLVNKAPNPEMREALQVMQPAFEKLAEIDENDPEAMSSFFELMMDEDIVAASEVLESYITNVCGFTDENATNNTSG